MQTQNPYAVTNPAAITASLISGGLAEAATGGWDAGAMTGPSAHVIADSIGPDGVRLTTFETVMHRWVLAENNTHKVVSKCAGSSRAVPVERQIERMRNHPALPLHYGLEQKGMQARAEIDEDSKTLVTHRWLKLMEHAIREVGEMRALGLHKQVANRLLEPFTYIRVVQTATAWDNMLDLRDHPDAQPEIAAVAAAMRAARDASTPVALTEGQFHLPYITGDDRDEVTERLAAKDPLLTGLTLGNISGYPALDAERILAHMSAARCARTSYLTLPVIGPDGVVIEEAKRDIAKDLDTCAKLQGAVPKHWSPFEHQATPWLANRQSHANGCGPLAFAVPTAAGAQVRFSVATDHLPRIGNLLAFRSLRTETEAILNEVTYR